MSDKMICFVILHYMALEETIACVDSIRNNVEGDKRIIIVDNASPNGSGDGLAQRYNEYSDVDVLKTEKNLGFANGNNFGFRYSVEKYNPDFIVVMNNDMEIRQPDFLQQIEVCYCEQHFSIMGPDIYSTKKQYHQNPQTRKLPTLHELKKSRLKLWIRDKLKIVIKLKWWFKGLMPAKTAETKKCNTFISETVINPMLHGSCYIFSRPFIERHQTECFYNETFMYLEAEILYYQALRDGEKMVYCPMIRVDHHEDVATDAEYKKQYQKSIFSVHCLLNSTNAFIRLIERDIKLRQQ